MINNSHAPIFAGFLLLLGSCAPATSAPPGLQGVMELDQRIIAFEVAGRILSVDVHRGDHVHDTILAHVDDKAARLARDARQHELEAAEDDLALLKAGARPQDVASTAAQVRAAKAAVDIATKTVERTRALRASTSISQAELDRAEAELQRATAEKQSLEQRLGSLQAGARSQEIARAKARIAGAASAVALEDERLLRYTPKSHGTADLEVLDVHVEPGELATVGAPIATLADTAHPYVDVFVPQNQIDGVKIGAKAEVRVDSPATPFAGVVEDIAHHTEFTPRYLFTDRERQNLVIRVRVRVEDPERKLHAGIPSFVKVAR
jgi:HlyD family secretion protein